MKFTTGLLFFLLNAPLFAASQELPQVKIKLNQQDKTLHISLRSPSTLILGHGGKIETPEQKNFFTSFDKFWKSADKKKPILVLPERSRCKEVSDSAHFEVIYEEVEDQKTGMVTPQSYVEASFTYKCRRFPQKTQIPVRLRYLLNSLSFHGARHTRIKNYHLHLYAQEQLLMRKIVKYLPHNPRFEFVIHLMGPKS